MAEVKVELIPDKTSSETGITTVMTRACAGRVKTVRRGGLERLRQGADRQVGQSWKKLVDKLKEKAEVGDLGSIKVLVMLAERKKPREVPVKKARAITLAGRLEEQPRWQGELDLEE